MQTRTRTANHNPLDSEPDDDVEASPVSGVDAQGDPCVSRWKNLSSEAQKKMWSSFKETGVFVTTCRHGNILLWCDMIRSGERYAITRLP